MPTQVEKLRKFQWWGGGLTSTPWNGNSKGVGGGGGGGYKANVPTVVRGGEGYFLQLHIMSFEGRSA